MKTLPQFLALLGISLVLKGCAPAAESSIGTQVSDSSGIRIVQNREPKWAAGQAWVVGPVPMMTLGVLDGPEEYQLVTVSAAARLPSGDLVVADDAARTVRRFSSDGSFLKTLGGPGSGPGEFRSPERLLVTSGDSVAVWDQELFRITWFGPDGELASVQSVDLGAVAKAIDPPLYPATAEPLQDGRLLVRLVEKTKGAPSGTFRGRSGALRVSQDYSEFDTLGFFGDTEMTTVDAPFGPFPMPPPFAKTTSLTHYGVPSTVCIGDQEGPEILCIAPSGERTLLRWESELSPPSDEEISAWRESTVRLHSMKLSEDDVVRLMDQIPVPEARPPYSEISFDRVGNLWVELGPSQGEEPTWIDYLVFDATGIWLGRVALPPIQLLEIGSDYVLGLYHDELEVEYLQLFGLKKPE